MTQSSHFDERGLAQLIVQLRDAFPAPVKVDYRAICQVSDAAVLSERDATELRKLGWSLTMLERGGFLTGGRFDNGEFQYFWDCQLTIKGYDAARKLGQASEDGLSAATVLSAFETTASA